jgi:FdhD protein
MASSQAVRTVRLERGKSPSPAEDRVAIEAPLEIRVGGRALTVIMRTPGHDEELALGFLYTEGLIDSAADVVGCARPPGLTGDEEGNVLAIELAPSARPPALERAFYSSSSCGVCGKQSIAQLTIRTPKSRRARLTPTAAAVSAWPSRLRAAQPLFTETGGVHGSALIDPAGDVVAVREDVGRHNAVDKLVGWALRGGRLPLDDMALVVSGRVSYEIVGKAIAAGIRCAAAIGAPSSLAIDLAEQYDLTLVGFVRAGSLNVYCGALASEVSWDDGGNAKL